MAGRTQLDGTADDRPAAPILTGNKPDRALVALVRYLARAAAERDYEAAGGGDAPAGADPEGHQ